MWMNQYNHSAKKLIYFSKRVGIVAIEEGQPTNGNSEFDQREENVNTNNNDNNVSGSDHVRR